VAYIRDLIRIHGGGSLSTPIRRFRRSLAIAAAVALPVAVLPVGTARAATESDVYVYASDPGGQAAATGSPADVGFWVSTSGPDPASDVMVSFAVTGGTISSLAVSDVSSEPASCDEASKTCEVPTLAVGEAEAFDVDVTRSTDGTATVTETITGSGSTDPDTSSDSNTASDDVQFSSPPSSTITNVSETPDADEDGVTVTATLRADGSPINDEELDVYAKPEGAPDASYIELYLGGMSGDEASNGVAHIDVYQYDDTNDEDVSSMLQGPVTLKIEHPADAQAGESSATVNVTPRPVAFSIKAADSVTYSSRRFVTVHGTVAVTGHPDIDLYGVPDVEYRPAGSSEPWKISRDRFDSPANSFAFSIPARVNTDLRVGYVGDSPGAAGGTSAVHTTDVRQRVKALASPGILPPHSTSTLSATIGPADPGGPVSLQKRAGSHWRTIRRSKLSGHSTASWSLSFSKVSHGAYRVVTNGTSQNAANTGAALPVTVERHAGGSPKQHTFLYQTGAGHARWNPCQPIHYWLNAKEAPAGGVAAAREALRRISQITKLHFVDKGKTREVPRQGRRQHHELIIAWVRPGQTNYGLGGGELGVGGGEARGYTPKDTQVVSGYAVLDSTEKLKPGFGAGLTEGELLLHELGHMTGLDHVKATSQIMYPFLSARPAAIYGAGDYRGLKLLGRSQGCIAAHHPPSRAHARTRAATPSVTNAFAY
jgi:hypothetical protein